MNLSEHILHSWSETKRKNYELGKQKVLPFEQLSHEQINFLNKLKNTVLNIDKNLSIIKNHGYSYEIAVAGGAIRDLLINKLTSNDIDVIVSFKTEKINAPNALKMLEKNEFVQDEFNKYIINCSKIEESLAHLDNKWEKKWESDMLAQKENDYFSGVVLTNLLKQQIQQSKDFNFEQIHYKSSEKIAEYMTNSMIGLLKLKDSMNNSIDVIFNSIGNYNFVNVFDFEICKGHLPLTYYSNESKNYENNFSSKTSLKEIYENIICHPGFYLDLQENTMSVKIEHFTPEHIDYFLNKHYLKMKEKFPHHKLQFIMNDQLAQDIQYKELINYAFKKQIEIRIDNEVEPAQKLQKIKI